MIAIASLFSKYKISYGKDRFVILYPVIRKIRFRIKPFPTSYFRWTSIKARSGFRFCLSGPLRGLNACHLLFRHKNKKWSEQRDRSLTPIYFPPGNGYVLWKKTGGEKSCDIGRFQLNSALRGSKWLTAKKYTHNNGKLIQVSCKKIAQTEQTSTTMFEISSSDSSNKPRKQNSLWKKTPAPKTSLVIYSK